MTGKLRAAMQQALEALEGGLWDYGPGQDEHDKCNEVITAVREALDHSGEANEMVAEQVKQEDKDLVAQMNIDVGLKQKVYEALAEQSEQEPMYISESCAERGCACHYSVEVDGEPVAVYSAPVRTKDLTDDEIDAFIDRAWDKQMSMPEIIRAVIAADREKNK